MLPRGCGLTISWSRGYTRVWFDGQSWQIEDCGSRNGTLVNSQRVQRAVLQPGDLIRSGDRLIVFACETNGRAAALLRPSVLTANTGVIRISEPGKRETLLEQLGVESSSPPLFGSDSGSCETAPPGGGSAMGVPIPGRDGRRLGQFERAHKGTIFLDEVGELSPACQAKLLLVLEGHPFQRLGGSEPIRVDVRLVSATHRDLRAMVCGGGFREDLYYRLRVIELRVPPLRERGDDLLDLAVTFLDRFGREVGRGSSRFSPLAAAAVVAYAWPGNVRKLKNAVERAVVLGQRDEVTVEDLGLPVARSGEMPAPQLVSLEEAERRHIEFVLRAVGGNKTQACKVLGIGRGALYKKLGEQED
jgi:hypothetical protein